MEVRIGSDGGWRMMESIDLMDSMDRIASVERIPCSNGRIGDGSVDLHGLSQHRGTVDAPLPPPP
jgi:hypothetical protein